ncbi:cytochrome c oxidase subunit 3 [Roseateles sp.]|uniref:cytochrome c oxidase subunit 3 n=1 Tax=Roseateles sp. TaxID=1971397 RepID=UPI002DFB774A|nr:cytochrome c oxidase subunit 3 [Roseateles sp.]HEV6965300.1 cytochrome c oxidase subunit 3 [Roseateles sp.]
MSVEADRAETARFGLWIFLSTEVLFFGALLLAYAWGRVYWPEGFATASRHTDVLLGTLNTGLLLTSSVLVALAVESPAPRVWSLLMATALGLAFLAIKGLEYRHDWRDALIPGPGFALPERGAQLFFELYFVMTALHAVHLLIGTGVLGIFAWGSSSRAAWLTPQRLELAGLYWHFVDIVWIVLYPLLYLAGRAVQ